MFCPSCGAETSEGLIYCKRCAAKLGPSRADERPKVAGLVWAISAAVVLVTLIGFIIFLGFLIEFGRDASSLMMALVGLLLLVVLAVDFLLARQLSRLISFHLHGGDGGRVERDGEAHLLGERHDAGELGRAHGRVGEEEVRGHIAHHLELARRGAREARRPEP
jgi:ABC-type nickel/cobalt efflux system permease component RcnA